MTGRVAPRLADVGWPLRTERLVLRPAVDEDEEAIWSYRRDATTARWLSAHPLDRDTFRAAFRDPVERAGTIVVESGGAVVGNLLVRIEAPWSQLEVLDQVAGTQAEIGWVLHPDHVGRGYATEAVEEVLRVCFEVLGLRRVVAGCFAANTASWRLMERVGMRREGYAVRDALHRSGEWMDSCAYALLAEEWRAAIRR
jgi:RimJ/RimL family protein N-acetyltransferase